MAKSKQQLSPQEKAKADAERKLKKATKFKELAGKRVAKALAAVRQVERLANRNSYVYSQNQAANIVTALANAVKTVQTQFARSPDAPKVATTFDVGE